MTRADRKRGDGAERKLRRELVTPEGVAIGLTLAGAGERLGGFVLDGLVMMAAIVAIAIVTAIAGLVADAARATLAILLFFFLRNFYFAFFELRWQGQTPGKRMMRTRVVDARGGPLTAEAIFARNLVREVEVFVPLSVLFARDQVWPGAPGWAAGAAALWALVVMLLPLFNKDRARVGDLIAGTRVVEVPRAALLPDLAGSRNTSKRAVRERPTFTPEQLSFYGAYELQVLADVLRRSTAPNHAEAIQTVYERVRRKVDWKGPTPSDPEAWLEEFYVAQRAHLERRMLFGKKKADKHSKEA